MAYKWTSSEEDIIKSLLRSPNSGKGSKAHVNGCDSILKWVDHSDRSKGVELNFERIDLNNSYHRKAAKAFAAREHLSDHFVDVAGKQEASSILRKIEEAERLEGLGMWEKGFGKGLKEFGGGTKSRLFDQPLAGVKNAMHTGKMALILGGAAALVFALASGFFGGKKKPEADEGYGNQMAGAPQAALPTAEMTMTEPPRASQNLMPQDNMPGSQVDISQILGNKGMQPQMAM